MRSLPKLSVVVFSFLAAFLGLARDSLAEPSWVPDELLVARQAGVSADRAESIYRSHGARVDREIPQIRLHVLKVPPDALERVEQALSRRPEVDFVERNFRVPPNLVPDDPRYSDGWHLSKIETSSAWDVTTGSSDVVIAILDSGVDDTHPDLSAKIVPGYNFWDGNTDTSDVFGHGTKVAGSAAAATDNATGVASVAWQGGIMPVRVTDPDGYGYYSLIAEGLTWASDQGARVMNLSFEALAESSTVESAAQYVVDNGGLVIAAAGNCGCDDSTSENPYLISVGATTSSDGLASFSARGEYVDLSAPGVGIWTTTRGGGYSDPSGTSFSSPVTAGVVALMMAANPLLSPADLESLLESTAVDLGATGWDSGFGFGRVDASAAVVAASEADTGSSDTTPPSATVSSPDAGTAVSGTINVSVTALDDVGVARVDLYVDGNLLGSDDSDPYTFAWDTTTVAEGLHDLQAVAYDAAGNSGSSDVVTVEVSNADSDDIAPLVTIDSPKDGSTVEKMVKVRVSASDDVQVQQVEVFVDGVSLERVGCDSASCTVEVNWNTNKEASGSHTLVAEGVDTSGNVGTSESVTVTVGSGSSDDDSDGPGNGKGNGPPK